MDLVCSGLLQTRERKKERERKRDIMSKRERRMNKKIDSVDFTCKIRN